MSSIYMQLPRYEDYKELERQMKDFDALETTHKSAHGFYHRSMRLRVNDDLTIEFHGPLVKAADYSQERAASRTDDVARGQQMEMLDLYAKFAVLKLWVVPTRAYPFYPECAADLLALEYIREDGEITVEGMNVLGRWQGEELTQPDTRPDTSLDDTGLCP